MNYYGYNKKLRRVIITSIILPRMCYITCPYEVCTLHLIHHLSMLLFCHVDDTLQIESQFLALDFHENE